MNSSRSDLSPQARRAYVTGRVVYVELIDGRVFGLPAQQVPDLAQKSDEALAAIELDAIDGRSVCWRGADPYDVTTVSVRDIVHGYPRAVHARVRPDRTVEVELRDGRRVGFPAANFSRLAAANDAQLAEVAVTDDGYGLRWESIDEDISVPGLIAGYWSDRKSA